MRGQDSEGAPWAGEYLILTAGLEALLHPDAGGAIEHCYSDVAARTIWANMGRQ